MKLDLTKLATALITTLVVGVMTYQLTTIRQLEIDNEITKVRLEQIEKKLKKRGKKEMNKLFENWNKFLEEESKDKYGSEVSDRAQDPLDNPYTFEQIEEMVHELLEADDRCTRIAKRKYDVWPSAYASGAVVKCRQR
jgi:RNA polymerase-binding transcription factor DksA